MRSLLRNIHPPRPLFQLSTPSRRARAWQPSTHQKPRAASSSTRPTSKTTDAAPRPTYNPISYVEWLEHYAPGGYHPIMIGDVLRHRYLIVDKLGFGGYSTVWLGQDVARQRYVALKVGTADSHLRETAILRELSAPAAVSPPASQGRDCIPCLLDDFELEGPNGVHLCYTVALAQCDIHTASYSELFPVEVARALAGGAVLAVAYLHTRGYAHGDIHLRNVLARSPPRLNHLSLDQFYQQHGHPHTTPITRPVAPRDLTGGNDAEDFTLADSQVLLSDFGEAYRPGSEPRLGRDCHTPMGSRPPESRFEPGAPLSYPADIWGLALTVWEILGMKAMFSNEFTTPDEVTAQQVDVLGPMPREWWESWDRSAEFFGEEGRLDEREAWPKLDNAFEEFIQKWRRKSPEVGVFGDEETAAILELMRGMLAFRPGERMTAEEVLGSEWMVRWVLPDVERSRRAG